MGSEGGGPRTIYILTGVLVVFAVIAAISLWQTDNSGTNSLSGDPQATSPPSTQGAP